MYFAESRDSSSANKRFELPTMGELTDKGLGIFGINDERSCPDTSIGEYPFVVAQKWSNSIRKALGSFCVFNFTKESGAQLVDSINKREPVHSIYLMLENTQHKLANVHFLSMLGLTNPPDLTAETVIAQSADSSRALTALGHYYDANPDSANPEHYPKVCASLAEHANELYAVEYNLYEVNI